MMTSNGRPVQHGALLPGYRKGKRVAVGRVLPPRELVSISGEHLSLPDARWMIHLQLRRFAGCPVCNLHLQSVVRRHDSIVEAGIREVVVFHSSSEELLAHLARKYGAHVYDQWSVDELLALARRTGTAALPRSGKEASQP